jgi:parallel beta-helix repeat protein
MKKSYFLLSLLMTFNSICQSIAAQIIEVSGDITENTTWSADKIKITGNVTISDNVTLTIEPGTIVEFQGYYWLKIAGTIRAEGNPDEWITFTINDTTGFSNPDNIQGSWYGLLFDNSPSGANGKMFDNDTSVFSYCQIEYGKRSSDSGDKYFYSLIYVYGYSKIKFLNNWIRHCTAMGAVIKCYFASPEFRNNKISECNAGDIIQMIELGNSLIIGNHISNNKGRGISVYFSSPLIINNIISNNTVKTTVAAGCGICISQGNPVIINNTICNNYTNGYGGALYLEGSEPLLYNNIIWGNIASIGNQIYLSDANLSPDIYHCAIQGGIAGFGGKSFSGIYSNNVESNPLFQQASGGAGILYDGLSADWGLKNNSPCINSGLSGNPLPYQPEFDFMGNSRVKYGKIDMGAIEYSRDMISVSGSINSNTLWLSDTVKVYNNVTVENGITLIIPPGVVIEWQGMYKMDIRGNLLAEGTESEYIKFTVNDTSYFSCRDSLRGGWMGIKFAETLETNDSSRIRYCIFEFGKVKPVPWSGGYGGAIYVHKFSELSILNCVFRNCMAERGGAIWISNSSIDIKNNLICRNYAATFGGGIALSNSNSILENNDISYNKCNLYGGGMYIGEKPGTPVITNCLIYNNFGASGGGIACFTNALFVNNTICNNKANSGGGMLLYSCKPEIYNSIFWGNMKGTNLNQLESWFQASPFIYYCDIQNGINGIIEIGEGIYMDNIEMDPLFQLPTISAGPGYYNENTDWTISDFSPCIDKGTLLDIIPETDFLGKNRNNNQHIDIGAIENQSTLLFVVKQPQNSFKCDGDLLKLLIVVSDTAIYQWQKDGKDITGANSAQLILENLKGSDQGNYVCRISNAYGSIESNPAYLMVTEKPVFLSEPGNTWAQEGATTILRTYAKGTNPSFQWQKNGNDIIGCISPELNISNTSFEDEGEYLCVASNSCGQDTTAPAILYLAPQICMVTVSTMTGNNLVVWEKNTIAPIAEYKIYRESYYAGIYDLLATLPYDALSIFIDSTADPTVQAYLYKITAVDTSGFETDINLSRTHKTIHLLITNNPETNATQLDWDRYVGFDYGTYEVFRSETTSNFLSIHSMASSTSTWADPDPGTGIKYYRIAALRPEPCYPTGKITVKAESGPYSQSMSNMEDNRFLTGISEYPVKSENLDIFPNPFTESTTLHFNNPEGHNYTLCIINLSGKVCRIVDNITTSQYILEKGDIKEGFYFIELKGPELYRGQIIVE